MMETLSSLTDEYESLLNLQVTDLVLLLLAGFAIFGGLQLLIIFMSELTKD